MNADRIQVSRLALQAITDALETLFFPPVADAAPLRLALSEYYHVTEECIVVGNGSTEIMNALVLAQADEQRDDILASSPTFSLYGILAKIHGLGLSIVPLKDYTHDIEALRTTANSSTRVIFLDSPHYTTGTTVTATSIIDLAVVLPKTIVVLDNVYGEFQTNEMSEFMREAVRNNPNILVCRSFSKVHALLGLRVGYGIGHPALIAKIQSKIAPYSVNSIAQAAAVASLHDVENVRRNVELNEGAKLMSYALLDTLGVAYVPTQSSTLLINFGNRAGEAAELCRQRSVKCRDEKKCGIPGHIQVHLIDPETITPFLEMLRNAFAQERSKDD